MTKIVIKGYNPDLDAGQFPALFNVWAIPVDCEGGSTYGLRLSDAYGGTERLRSVYAQLTSEGDLHPGDAVWDYTDDSENTVAILSAYKGLTEDHIDVNLVRAALNNLLRNALAMGFTDIGIPLYAESDRDAEELHPIVFMEILRQEASSIEKELEIDAVLHVHAFNLEFQHDTYKVDGDLPLRAMFGQALPVNNGGFDLSLPDIVRAMRLEDNRRKWSRKTGYYHPSAMSESPCFMALAMDRLGVIPQPQHDAQSYVYFDVGTDVHEFIQHILHKNIIQKRLRQAADSGRLDAFEDEVLSVSEALKLWGSADGVLTYKGWKMILEIKTSGPELFRKLVAPKKDHIRQAHCYMFCLDVPHTVFVYIDRDKGGMKQFVVGYQPKLVTDITNDIYLVEQAISRGSLPNRKVVEYECSSCKFFHACRPDLAAPGRFTRMING